METAKREYVAPKLVVYGAVKRLTTDFVKPGGSGDTMQIPNPDNQSLSPNWYYT